MLQALQGTSRSVALGRGVPSEAGDGWRRAQLQVLCRACACVRARELILGVEVANFQLEARTNTDDWTMPWQDSGVSRWAGEGGRGHSSSEADPVMVRLKFYVNSRRLTGSRELRRAGNCGGPSSGMACSKTPKSAASGVTNLGFYVGP